MKTNLAKSHLNLAIAEREIAKILSVSELSQIGRAEKRTRAFLFFKWEELSKRAMKLASMEAKKTKNSNKIISEINVIMEGWKHSVLSNFSVEFASVYRLARNIGYKKATGQTTSSLQYGLPQLEIKKADIPEITPSFDLIDQENIKSLTKHQVFWIGDFYKNGVSKNIAKTVREVMAETGGGSAAAGKLMEERISKAFKEVRVPAGFIGTPKQYFAGLTANAFTVARVHGQLRSFAEIGITHYTIVNPVDKRTCSRCAHLEGKTFSTRQGLEQMHQELKANSKEEVKSAHPWLSLRDIQKISPVSGYVSGKAGIADSNALAKAGQAIPPFHYKCRCTVDVSTESISFENLVPLMPPTSKIPPSVVEIGKPGEILRLNDKIEKLLTVSIPVALKQIKVAGSDKTLLTLRSPDGKKSTAIRDKTRDLKKHNSEVAFYQLDKELGGSGIVQPTIKRDLGVDSGISSIKYHKDNWKHVKEITPIQERRIRLLDFISGNGNRSNKDLVGSGDVLSILNNGGSFRKQVPKKYGFPTLKKNSEVNVSDVSRLRRIGLDRIAEILKKNEVSEQAAKQALFRVKFVLQDKKLLSRTDTIEIWSTLKNDPSKLLKPKDIKQIESIISKIY